MRKVITLLFVSLLIFSSSAAAQSKEKSSEQTYKGHFQYGLGIRLEPLIFFAGSENAVVGSFGYRFNRKRYLGLNAGVSAASVYFDGIPEQHDFLGVPLTLDYIHYCPMGKKKNNSFFYGAELGAIITNKESEENGNLSTPICFIKAGFDFRMCDAAHINFGLEIGFLTLGLALGVSF